MSLLFLDGADDGLQAEKWDVINGTWSIVTGRNGNGYQKTSGGGASTKRINLTASEEHATLTVGFAAKFTALAAGADSTSLQRARFFRWKSDTGSTTHIMLGINAAGGMAVYLGTGVGSPIAVSDPVISVGVWHYIETQLTLSDTVGVVKVWVDGALVIDETNVDTKNGGTKTVFDAVEHYADQSDVIDPVFDDFYLTNGAGAVNTGRLGDITIETLFPNGDGASTQFTPLTGPANYTEVDESPNPDDDTSYVESSTDGHQDLYTFDDLAATAATIMGLIARVYAKHTGSADNLRVLARPTTTTHVGADQAVASSYDEYAEIWEQNPDGGAWTIAAVNASEFGVENRP